MVDDAEANIDVLVLTRRDEYRSIVAVDCGSVLRFIEMNPPDIALLDIVMPGLDGCAVCRRTNPWRHTRAALVLPTFNRAIRVTSPRVSRYGTIASSNATMMATPGYTNRSTMT